MSSSTLRHNALASALALALFAPFAVSAQTAPDPVSSDKAKTQELEKVVVTGSRIKRVEIEGASPVVTLTGDDLKRQGFTTVADALQSMPQFAPNPQPDVGYNSRTQGGKPLNLRNFGPGRSLLLVNGQRVADYPQPYGGQSNFSNYGNIPAAAIDRIEILASGASAIYGSDAVGGVINIILKKHYEGDQITARAGGTELGGGAFNDFAWTGGKIGDNWSLTYIFENYRAHPVIGRDRPFMDSNLDKPRTMWNQSDRAIGIQESTGIRLIDNDTGKRISPPNGAATCSQFGSDMEYFHRQRYTRTGLGQGTVTDLGYQCGYIDNFGYNTLDNGQNNQHGYLYGTYNFTDSLQAWSSLALYETLTAHQSNPPAAVLFAGGDYTWFDPGFVDKDHPNGRTITSAVRQFTPAEVGGGLDQFENHTRNRYVDFSVGLKGKIFNDRFDWEVAARRSQDKAHESFLESLNSVVDAYFLGPQLGTTADGTRIYKLDQQKWWNPLTPTEYAKIMSHVVNDAKSWVTEAQATVSGDLFQGWAGPIGFAAEVEAARQGYELSTDPRLLAGDFDAADNVGFADQGGGTRNRYAIGAETRVPILSNLTANIGARWDRYNAVRNASHASYMTGLEYRPLDNLLLRGTYATSFRAPDMHYTYARASSQSTRITDQYLCQKDGSTYPDCGLNTPYTHNVLVTRQGSTQLDYEKGHSFTYGAVWNALDNLSLSVDYWYIFLKGEIQDVSADDELSIERACAFGPNGALPPTAGDCAFVKTRIHRDARGQLLSVEQGPINKGGQRNGGIDASLKYKIETPNWGNFNLGMDYTLSTKYQTEARAGEPWVDERFDHVIHRLRGTVEWQYGPWTATVLGTRQNGLKSGHYSNCLPLSDGFIPRYSDCTDPLTGLSNGRVWHKGAPPIFYNASVGYAFNEKARINLYVTDVFNKADVRDNYSQDYAWTWFNIYNQLGRQYSLEFAYKFD